MPFPGTSGVDPRYGMGSRSTLGFMGTGPSRDEIVSQDRRRTALGRLNMLGNEFTQNPGAAPGGTGRTGLLPGDATGYSQLLERQQEFLGLQNQLQGKQAPGISTAPYEEEVVSAQEPNIQRGKRLSAISALQGLGTQARGGVTPGNPMQALVNAFRR